MVYNKKLIEQLLEGYWYRKPQDGWYVDNIDINKQQIKNYSHDGYKTLFIAIDSETWHRGSGNTGIYAGWNDTHQNLKEYETYMSGVIARRPIEDLNENIPQFIMNDTYSAIRKLGQFSYEVFKGKTIEITGTAGKSTCKSLLKELLSENYSVNATRGNHNTRTGVPLTIANAINQPDYLVLEVAVSSLWMRNGGIAKTFVPDIAMITSIDGGQEKNAHEIAVLKSKIAEGMNHLGNVVVNRDMNEYETVVQTVKQYNKNIITYGFNKDSDAYVIRYEEFKFHSHVDAYIMGENISFDTQLSGEAMIQNIVGALTIIKLLGISCQSVLSRLEQYKPNMGVQNFEEYTTKSGDNFTLINDAWNAMGISMLEGIRVLKKKSKFYKGKTIAVLGRIIGLDPQEAKRQHELIADELIKANIDIVFGHGKEMKYAMKKLPKEIIGGYYENADQLAIEVANIIQNDDLVLIKGSVRNSDFKNVKSKIISYTTKGVQFKLTNTIPSNGYGVATYNVKSGIKVASIGKQDVVQNQGIGGILLINHILDLIFANQLELHQTYKPDRQAIRESVNSRAIPLKQNDEITLNDLLSAAIVTSSPNAILMLANTVKGSNKESLEVIKKSAQMIGAHSESALNITGRRIKGKRQHLTLEDLYLASKLLFNKYPFIKDILSRNNYVFKNKLYKSESNLFSYGIASHGIFYGQEHSIGAILSKIDGEEYITVVIGARDAFHRDALIYNSIMQVTQNELQSSESETISENRDTPYTINIIGDTYFGEFYTERRRRKGIDDALTLKNRHYSFEGIRDILEKGDFNVCNFEAAISDDKNDYLKQRKPFVLNASEVHTVETLKKENIQLATLANNHLMDCGVEGLERTVNHFNLNGISTIGAAINQNEAEKPFNIIVNNQNYAIFNAYWYRRPMHREYDFYAIGNEPGVACLNPFLYEKIREMKDSGSKVIVIAHWGVDFGSVHAKQREYAKMLQQAGVDLIIGHGAHMMQKIEYINDTTVVYSIGNGVFNSNGEYDQRYVPPYSFIAQLIISSNNQLKLKLYPIYGNNLETFWQPRFLTELEFNHCRKMLEQYSGKLDIINGRDDHFYFEVPLKIN
ncbi:CapA family protein [Staphylococcus sp. GDX8P54P]|uniref:CapA family protein n=1 Tax=Staphylococcus sp. GDX8P54P TaxID=2804099 RepID=UPI001AEC2A38|nr:CapA family protein [Staphylococcus sp. GDX8P54P]